MYRVKYSLTLILSLIFFSSLAHAQSYLLDQSYDKQNTVTAKLLPLVGQLPTSGYMPFRLILKNGSKSEKNWELSFTSTSVDDYSYYSRNKRPTLSSNFDYTCPAESSKTYDILVPVTTSIASNSYDVASSEMTVHMKSSGEPAISSLEVSQHLDVPSTLLSTELYVQHSSKFNSLIPHSSRGYSTGNEDYTTEFTPTSMSNDWRAYSGFDVLICTDIDWLTMTVEARSAILEWNRLGGDIYIYKLNPASNFNSLDIDETAGNKSNGVISRSFGNVTISSLSDIKSLDPSKVHKLITKPKAEKSKISSINNNYNQSSYKSSAWSLLSALGKLSFSPIYLILILVIFGILVGPVNLFVFAKSGQRHRLFITTPLIAIGASIALIGLIIIQDGFGGHGQRVQLIEVRADGENKAYVWQEQASRTGVILGGSFETSSPALMSPVPVNESRFSRVTRKNSGGACNYTADSDENGIVASGDWFQSRSVHGHYLESVIPTRGRINLQSNQDAPVLNSLFDYNIDSLIYIDDSGNTWEASEISAGDSVKLISKSPADAVKLIHEHQKDMSPKLKKKIEDLRKRRNHFIALTFDAPAIDTLDSIKWTKTASIITGPVVK